jgi:hypothetical protein
MVFVAARDSEPLSTSSLQRRAWRIVSSPAAFCLAIAAMLLLGRWPWLSLGELNPDESLWLANALRYLGDVVPWRATNSGTSGPLTPWLLTVLSFLGAPLTHHTTHCVAAGLQILTICFAYGTIRVLADDATARLTALPSALLMSRTCDPDFVHLSSENVPLALMAGCCWAAACGIKTACARPAGAWLVLAGLLAGSVAFAKLQAVPIAAATCLVILAGIAARFPTRPDRIRAATLFLIGVVIVPTLIFGLVLAGESCDEMWRSYINANLAYGPPPAQRRPWYQRFVTLVGQSPVFVILCLVTALLATLATVRQLAMRGVQGGKFSRGAVASGLLLIVAVLCVTKPGYEFRHYLMLLTLPCMMLIGTSLFGLADRSDAADGRMIGIPVAAAILPLAVVAWCIATSAPYLEGRAGMRFMTSATSGLYAAESLKVAEITEPRDEIAVWGWRPDIYATARRRPAVRDVAVLPDSRSAERFLQDLQAAEPRLFIDAVCPAGFPAGAWPIFGRTLIDRQAGGFEAFPILSDYVGRRYVWRGQVVYDGGSIRIYERRREHED